MPGKPEQKTAARPDGLVVPIRANGNFSPEAVLYMETRTAAFQKAMNRKGAPYAIPSPKAKA